MNIRSQIQSIREIILNWSGNPDALVEALGLLHVLFLEIMPFGRFVNESLQQLLVSIQERILDLSEEDCRPVFRDILSSEILATLDEFDTATSDDGKGFTS